MRHFVAFVFCLIVPSICIAPSPAAAQVKQGQEKSWHIFTLGEGAEKQCYIAAMPTSQKGTFKKRGQPYAIITLRENQPEVSITSGYPHKAGEAVELTVTSKRGDASFSLFSEGEQAWAKTEEEDRAITDALKRGSALIVRATSSRGTTSEDSYALEGISAALEKAENACK